jgi:DNA (cytosine-5)-methyltransferase 1
VIVHAIDQFGGPGGWDVAAEALGIHPIGIEWDGAACQTREAAGLWTLQADVAALDPLAVAESAFLGLWGTHSTLSIASPPCPTFSNAGKGAGIADMPLVYEAAAAVADGSYVPGRLPWQDIRSELVVEPLRWALALRPDYIAWEQVPPVLGFWEHCATILRAHGWSVWTGVLEAERYGVPQTRERAILIARRDGRPAHPPRPTHQRYVKGEPARHEVTLEGEILPWVSMAEALGWAAEDEVGFPRASDGDEGEYRERDRRPATEPSFTLGEKARSWDRLVLRTGANSMKHSRRIEDMVPYERPLSDPAPTLDGKVGRAWKREIVQGSESNATRRAEDEPAPTVKVGHDAAGLRWITHLNPRQTPARSRPIDEPAPAMLAKGLSLGVPVWDRGEKDLNDPTAQDARAIRVSLEEAAVLQSFHPDYPFEGSKTKQFEQVGNAVPPLLAHAVLSALLSD